MSKDHQDRIEELNTLLLEISNEIDRIQEDKSAPEVLRLKRLEFLSGQYFETKGRLDAYGVKHDLPKPRMVNILRSAKPAKVEDLAEFSTASLVAELRFREGVKSTTVTPHQDQRFDVNGPAIVLIVTD